MIRNILMLVPHNPGLDPRIKWSYESLSSKFKVNVLGIDYENASEKSIGENIHIKLNRYSNNYLTIFFLLVRQLYLIFNIFSVLLLVLFFPLIIILVLCFLFIETSRALKLSGVINLVQSPIVNRYIIHNTIFPIFQLTFAQITASLLIDKKKLGQVDLIFCNDLSSLFAGVILKKEFGVPLVYDAHEFYPEILPYKTLIFKWAMKRFESKLIEDVNLSFTVSPGIIDLMKENYHVQNIHLLPNAEPLKNNIDKVNSGIKSAYPDKIIFLFQGSYSEGRGLEEIIKAWHNVKSDKALLVFRGKENSYSSTLRRLATNLIKNGRMIFIEPVNEELLISAASEADVGIIPYKPVCLNYEHCCPNKLSQYMQGGLAVLHNNLPFVNTIIEEAQCGVKYNSEDLDSFSKAVDTLVSNERLLIETKGNSLKYVKSKFNWQIQSRILLESIDALFLNTFK